MQKVAIIKCESYDEEKVYQALKRGLDLLGGINQFIKPKDKILLKPNLLYAKTPDKQATTHPSVFAAIIRLLKESQCHDLTYGDSPGFGSTERVADVTGLKITADEHNVKLADFSKGQVKSFPGGHQCKQFQVAQGALEADSIIDLSKMKTHQLTHITGAIKNQLGCIYGIHKGAFHVKFPDAQTFSKMLVDLNLLLKPKLYLMDAIIAMDGNGPGSGDPIQMNALIISTDPVALDATFCRMIDLDPKHVPSNVYGQEFGLGTYLKDEIEIVGDPLDSFVNLKFNVARKPIHYTGFNLAKYLRNYFLNKPFIDAKKCTKCGNCIVACPIKDKALNFPDGNKTEPPIYNYQKCIRCYCCQEMCPQKAIYVKTPLLGRIFLYRK